MAIIYRKPMICAIAVSAVALFAGCGNSDSSSQNSKADFKKLSPNMVVVDGKEISLTSSDDDITEAIGGKYASDMSKIASAAVSSAVLVKTAEGEHKGFSYVSFANYYPKRTADDFVAFNGICGNSSVEDVEKILGDNCIKIESESNTDYFCYFVDGEEIDYSQVTVPEGFVDTMGIDPYGQNYCENLLEEKKNKMYICWKFLQSGEYFDCECTINTLLE